MSDIEPEDQLVFDRLKSTGRITHSLRRLMTAQWNTCSVCDHIAFPGRPLFAGYGEGDEPLYTRSRRASHCRCVGQSCSTRRSIDFRQPRLPIS